MQKRLPPLLIPMFVFFLNVQAQQIDSAMNHYAEQLAPEKLHLHLDRSIYNRNEPIFFKAYLLSDHELSALSKNLYVDFYDDKGNLLQQAVSPLLQSSAKGSFLVPQNYTGSVLFIKAYTKWMLNFDTALLYTRTIHIFQPGDKAGKKNDSNRNQTTVSLYPEGGYAIEGLSSRFAFSSKKINGTPVKIKGVLKSSDGKKTDSIPSLHDGMGSFRVPLQNGLTYTFEWQDENGLTGIETIVAEKKYGATLKIFSQKGKSTVSIERSGDAPSQFKTMHLLVHKNYNLHYKFDLNMSATTFVNIPVNTADFSSGIVQFTLFDERWVPVAERIIFVNNKNYLFQSNINILSKSLDRKGKNELEIGVTDTLLSNMSLAIVDANTVDEQVEPSVYSDLLMRNDLRGNVFNPSYYFSEQDNDSLRSAYLDLVMLTQGHRRYDWEKIAKGILPVVKFSAEEDYLGIRGKLTSEKLLKAAEKLSMNVMIQGKDSVKTTFIVQGNKEGVFEKKNTFYYDTVKLFYNLNDKKSIRDRNIFEFDNGLMTNDARSKVFKKRMIIDQNDEVSILGESITGNIFFSEQETVIGQTKFKELQEVVVSSRIKPKIQILDEFYTKGVFAGEGNNYKVDIEGDISARGFNNIFYYLQSKIPGLGVQGNGSVTWLKSFSLYGVENSEPSFFLDEAPVSLEAVYSIPVADIAYVKAFRPPFVGSFLNGVNGTIAIYTRKGYNPVYQDTTGGSLASSVLVGYTKFREFTQPDYSDTKTTLTPDYRATVYWNPFLLTDKFNQKVNVSFYNNDISKRLVAILEGVNLEGKLTRVVKLIE